MPILKIDKNLILACQISGIYDVNRNETLADDDYSLIKDWCESIINLDLQGIIFHNNYSETFCEAFSNNNIEFIKVEYDPNFNPNIYRYSIYEQFLKSHFKQIKNVFVTDVSDVVVIKNPFEQPPYKANPNFIFCGDEPKKLENEWMKSHSQHLRNKIEDYAEYEEKYKDETLLNCGIIGGNINVMSAFIEQLSTLHQNYNFDNKTAYTGDMGAFNYLIRTKFNDKFLHGFPINTEFKAYQNEREDCWFRHK
jgi:hypothetical protein